MRCTLLFVDDEEMVTNALKRVMRNENMDIFTAQSGKEALALIAGRDFHVVVSDYSMPGMNGLELLSRVKQESPETITIMLTGRSEIEIAMKAINEAGVYKFILKPWDPNDLLVTLRRTCESFALMQERNSLVEKIRRRDTLLNQLEQEHPGITKVIRDEEGYIIAEE